MGLEDSTDFQAAKLLQSVGDGMPVALHSGHSAKLSSDEDVNEPRANL